MGVCLNHTSEQFLEVFDALRLPILVADKTDGVLFMNAAGAALFECQPEEARGKRLEDFVTYKASTGVAFDAGTGGPAEMQCTKYNGDTFVAEVVVIPYGGDKTSLVVVQDISGKKSLELRASQRTKELSIFNIFSEVLNNNGTMQETLTDLMSRLPVTMGADTGWIHLYDERAQCLVLKTCEGCEEGHVDGMRKLDPGQCLSGRVFASKRPLLVRDAPEDPRVTNLDVVASGIRSIAAVPIISKGAVLGVMAVASSQASYFSSMDMQLLATLGGQLGVAIENARLVDQLRQKVELIELSNELSSSINSSLSIGAVFKIMVSEIRKVIDYDRASLLLYDEKEDNLIIYALDTDMKTVMPRGVRAPIKGTSAGWVQRHNKPWINYDLRVDARFEHDRKLAAEGIRSTVSIPLHQDRMLGVFNLDSTVASKYSERDLQVLLPVAKHIAIALENALLFEEITKEKKEWERTFDAIADMLWITDLKHNTLRANNALLERAGLSSVQVSSESCTDLLDRFGIPSEECLCVKTARNKRHMFAELSGSAGNIYHFWTYPLSDDNGKIYAMVHYLKDVTDHKRLEQQLIRADKLASLGTLVAGIAHEINNPLGIIACYSEALLDRADDSSLLKNREFADFPEYLKTIHNEIFRCKEILDSLLEFSRPQKGLSREIDINELIKEVILLVNHKAKRLQHNIEFDLNRSLPKLCAEPGSLRQLFMNIIINSMYYTKEGGDIRISSSLIEQEGRGEMVSVAISDTGSGIPANVMKKIFDPFFTTKPIGEGTGLGLAICHRIAEEHGGLIDVSSELGKGTTFTIKIPAKGSHGAITCG